ncbi:hypothetical protein B566_EDAN015644 [Ephemera danica]|nr:hypothetical protein B566_EDAN015644 [Ephemera danica]
MIYNYSAADGLGDTLFNSEATRATVQHHGAVTWAPQVRLQALCSLYMAKWPMDRQTCLLQLGVWSHGPFVKLHLWENGSALEIQHTGSQWRVEDVSALPGMENYFYNFFKNSPFLFNMNGADDISDQDTSVGNSSMSVFWLQVTVQRMSRIYYTLLLTPLTMISIQMIASFWVSPLDYSRLILCEINLLLMLLLLITIGFTLPASSDTVPRMSEWAAILNSSHMTNWKIPNILNKIVTMKLVFYQLL